MAIVHEFTMRSQGQQQWQDKRIKGEVVPLEMRGERFLQIYSLGSDERQHVGARSQNLRLDRAAFEQLVEIGRKHFGEK